MSILRSIKSVWGSGAIIGVILAAGATGASLYLDFKHRIEALEQRDTSDKTDVNALRSSLSDALQRLQTLEAKYTSLLAYTQSLEQKAQGAVNDRHFQRCNELSDKWRAAIQQGDRGGAELLRQERIQLKCL